MKIISDLSYAKPEQCKLDLYLPEGNLLAALVFFHGGGMESGDKKDVGDVFQGLIEQGVAVVSCDYRMYPQAKYPEFIEDAAAAVSWVSSHIGAYGACEKLYVSGSSAGAYLSMMLCLDKKYLGAHGIDADSIAGYIFDSAQPTTHFNVLRERGLDTRRVIVDEAAPLYHIGENPNAAPMLILVSDHDIPGRLEQTMLFCSALRHFGYDEKKITCKIMEGYEHTKYFQVKDENGSYIFTGMVWDFIRSTL